MTKSVKSLENIRKYSTKNEKIVTTEILLERLGGFSNFQLWAVAVTLLPEIVSAMVSLSPILTGSQQLAASYKKTSSFPGASKSVVQEWDLVGSNAWISDLFTSFQMFGALVGSILSGYFAERYGRKKAHFILCFLMGLFGFASGWAPDPYTFCVFRFFAGFAVGGCYVVYLNYLMEFLTPSWRTVCGCVSLWAVGEMLLALLGYLLSGWRQLLWATSAPVFLVLLAYRWMPESPRWLLCQGKTEEAMEVFDQIARWNGRPALDPSDIKILQKQMLSEGENDDKSSIYTITTISCGEESSENFYRKKSKYPGCLSSLSKLGQTFVIFKYKQYRLQLMILMFSWFASQLIYYGISFNMKNLSGDPYLNILYMGAVGLPGSFAGLLFNNRLGRRTTIIGFTLISTLFLAALIFFQEALSVQHPSIVVFLCLAVRLFVAAGFAVLACFTAESFPTVVRVSCMGICALVGNIGGILAPQFVYLSTIVNSAQYITFGLLSLAMIIGAVNLEEMTGKPLEDFLRKSDELEQNNSVDVVVDAIDEQKIHQTTNNIDNVKYFTKF